MGLKSFNPYTASRRFMTVLDKSHITKDTPEKNLLEPKKRSGGRNNQGEVVVWHRGGGHKKQYRVVDFRRDKDGIPAKVASIEYDPNRSANIALLHYADGDKRYILHPVGLEVGATVSTGESADILPGNSLKIRNIPPGTMVHNLELYPGRGGQAVRTAGASAQLAQQGRRPRSRQDAFRRSSQVFHRLPRHRWPGRQCGSRESDVRQGWTHPLEGHSSHGSRRGHEPRGSPARRW